MIMKEQLKLTRYFHAAVIFTMYVILKNIKITYTGMSVKFLCLKISSYVITILGYNQLNKLVKRELIEGEYDYHR